MSLNLSAFWRANDLKEFQSGAFTVMSVKALAWENLMGMAEDPLPKRPTKRMFA